MTPFLSPHTNTHICHHARWFQPLGGEGVRHGLTGQVELGFFKFDYQGRAVWDLKGKDLLQGGGTDAPEVEGASVCGESLVVWRASRL